MNVPADAALDPVGATNEATGTSELWIFLMISRMEVSSPPGVSMCNTINESFSALAWLISYETYSATAGLIAPESLTTTTLSLE